MKMQVSQDFVNQIRKNKFLQQKARSFSESVQHGTHVKFLDENPDFVQMMMHLANSDEIKIQE